MPTRHKPVGISGRSLLNRQGQVVGLGEINTISSLLRCRPYVMSLPGDKLVEMSGRNSIHLSQASG